MLVIKKYHNWTLLYLDGKFRTNANKNYPNVNNFQYNGVGIIVNGSGQYSSGTTAHATLGSDSNGYKWIVFKLTKSSGGYSMMGLTISIDQNGDDQKYLDLKVLYPISLIQPLLMIYLI